MTEVPQLRPAEPDTVDQLGRSVLEVHAAARSRLLPSGTSPQAPYLDGRIAMLRARLHRIQNGENPSRADAARRQLIADELVEQRRWAELPLDQIESALMIASGAAAPPQAPAAQVDPTRALVARLRGSGVRFALGDDGETVRVAGANHLSAPDLRALRGAAGNIVHLLTLEAEGVLVLRPRAPGD